MQIAKIQSTSFCANVGFDTKLDEANQKYAPLKEELKGIGGDNVKHSLSPSFDNCVLDSISCKIDDTTFSTIKRLNTNVNSADFSNAKEYLGKWIASAVKMAESIKV